MKFLRQVAAWIGFLLVWIVVSAIGVWIVRAVFGATPDPALVIDWRFLPAQMFGIWAGYWVFRKLSQDGPSARKRQPDREKHDNRPVP